MANPFDIAEAEAQATANPFDVAEQANPFDLAEQAATVEPVKDELGIGEEVRGVGREFKRGLLSGQQQLIAGELATAPKGLTIRQERQAYERGMKDPRLMEMVITAQGDPLKERRAETLVGPTGKRNAAEGRLQDRRTALASDLAALEQTQQAIPATAAMEEWNQADNSNWWRVLAKNPVEITAGIMAQSIPAMAPAMAANIAAPGGRVTRAIATGTGSLAVEGANAFLDAAISTGYDLADPVKVLKFFDDPWAQADARAFALKRGVPIAVFDALTAGIAGKFAGPALKQGAKKILVAGAKEAGLQAAGGAGGEAAAQLASGQKLSLKDIVAEALGEIASAPQEVISNLRNRQPGESQTPPEPRREPPPGPATPPADLSPDSLKDLEEALRGNQLKPEERASRNQVDATVQEMLKQARAEKVAQEGAEQTEAAATTKPLTPAAAGAITIPGAAAETGTGQNERTGSDAVAATTLAAKQMPAEGETSPKAAPSPPKRKSSFYIRPRSDGVPDILDAIQELGGLRPPGPTAGGEYDGWREAMTGPARMLVRRGAAHGPDTLIMELKDLGAVGAQRLETADDLWNAISAAVKGREKLRTVDVRQREEAKQTEQFQKRAIAGERPKNDPTKAERISVGSLLEGDQFKVQNHTFTVQSLEFDDAGNLIFVEVKDGPKFGVQRIEADGTEWIHVDKNTFQAGPEHGEDVQPVRPPKLPVPDNRSLGGETKGPALTLAAESGKRESRKAETLTKAEQAALRKELADLQRDELNDAPSTLPSDAAGRYEALRKLVDAGTATADQRAEFEDTTRENEKRQGNKEAVQAILRDPSLTTEQKLERIRAATQPGAATLREDASLFGEAETVEQQRARLKLEAQRRAEAAARDQAQAKARRKLTGADVDTSGEMFGAETRQDKSGQGSFFETSESLDQIEQRTAALDPIAQDLYGRPYAELTADQQGKVRVTLDHADAEEIQKRAESEYQAEKLAREEQIGARASGEPPTQQRPVKPGRRDAAQKREAMAQEIFRKPYAELMDEGQARVREELAGGRKPGTVLKHPVEIRLRELMDERSRLEERLRMGPHMVDISGNIPKGRSVALATQIRYIDGQIDMLREIARADPKLKSQFIEKFLEGDTPKEQHQTIAKIVDWLESLKMDMSGGQMHAFGLIPKTWNDLIDAVLAAIRGGQTLADAIDFGISRIKAAKTVDLDKFDEAGARKYFETTQPGNLRYEATGSESDLEAMKNRRDELDARLAEINTEARRAQKRFTGLDPQLKSERFALAKEARELNKKLLASPEYVAELLRGFEKKLQVARAAEKAGDTASAREELENARTSTEATLLEKVEPDLYERVRKEMEAAGEIEPSKLGQLPAGRTMGDLNAWLKSNKLDSPRIPLRERFNLARRLADEFNRGKDGLSKAANRVSAMWHAFKSQYKAPPVDDSFRSLMKDWFFEKQWTGLETHKWVELIRQAIPQADRRRAVSVWLDAQGDMNLLQAQADLVPPRFKRIWETALTLTSKEQAAARRIALDFEQKLSDSMNLGVIQKGRAEYGVPQIWEIIPRHEGEFNPFKKKTTARRTTAKLDPRAPFFALQRTHPTYFDGIMAGGIPKSLDVGDLVAVYNLDFHNSLADRAVIKAMKDAKTSEGDALVMISGGVRIEPGPEGSRTYFADSNRRPKDAVTKDGRPYVTVDHWALRDWQFKSVDAQGNPILLSGEFLVHPDHQPFLKNELGKSWLRDPHGGGRYFNWILNSGAFLKASKLAVGTFHMFTLGEHLAFHAISGKPTARRIGLLNPSIHGVEFDPAKNPDLALLMRHGMNLGLEGPRELFEEGLMSHGGLWGHVPGLGDVMTKLSSFCFQRYLPALKVRFGDVILDANRKRYAKEVAAGEITDDQIAEITARQANAAFGAQHWKLMGTNKTLLDVNRLLFLAPDFLLSRAKVVSQAVKPYNREQTLFLLAQAGLVYLGARMLNLLLDDDPHWEPENAMRVVYKGRSYAARFIVQDIVHLIDQPVEFAGGRISPWGRTTIEALTGRDMWSGARKDIPIDTENKAFRSAQIVARDMYDWMIPIGAEGYMPGASARAQTGPGNLALSLIGVGSRKYTAQTQLYQLAADFNRKGDAAAQLHQKQRDAQAHGESDFAKMDNLLDAGELAKARREYIELVKEGRKPKNIAGRYKVVTVGRDGVPHLANTFTGSVEREKEFRRSLTPAQLETYDRAIEERKKRAEQFAAMLRVAPAPAGESLPTEDDEADTPAP